MANPKQKLREFIAQQKKLKADSDNERQRRLDDDRTKILEGVGGDLAKSLGPVLPELAKSAQISEETIRKAFTDGLKVNMPEIDTAGMAEQIAARVSQSITEAFAGLKFPQANVNVPAPVVNIPKTEFPSFPDRMNVGLENYNNKNPMPVMMMGLDGKPFTFSFPTAAGGGGKTDFFTIKDIQKSIAVVTVNPDGQPFYPGTSSSGAGSTTVALVNADNVYYNGDNPLPQNLTQLNGVVIATGTGVQNTGTQRVVQALDAVSSTASGTVATAGDTATNNILYPQGQNVAAGTSALMPSLLYAFNGSNPDRLRNTPGEGNALRVQHATDAVVSVNVVSATGTTATAIIDSSGVQYSGSNPLPVTFAAAGFQNVATYDAQQSTITSHQDPTGDFRGLDISLLDVVNVVSALNSSTTTLGIGGEFTGLAEEVKDYASIQVFVISDAVSSTNGLMVQQSSDGTNWDVTDSYTIAAATGKTFSFQPVSRYFRIFYANGGSAQTSFRLSTIHHYVAPKASSQRSADTYSNETDLEQVWAFNSAYNSSNDSWDRLRSNSGEGSGLRVQMATDAVASVHVASGNTLDVKQVSGASDSVNILAGTITTVTTVTGITNSVATVGNVASDVADNGDGPIKIGGIARTANPTAVAAGDRVSATFDDLGRQVVRNVQVRDLIQTAYVSVTNGTETTLRAGVAGAFLDLIMIVASNNSDAAVSVDIRPVTNGNIVNTLRIQANGTAGWTPAVPWPQTDTGNNWTVDGPDETGRTLTFSALFSQEI